MAQKEHPRTYYIHTSLKIKIFGNGTLLLSNKGLHKELGVPTERSLSSFIPEGTVIVIDQIDGV